MRYDVGRFRRPMRRSTEGQLASLVSLGDGSTLTLDFTTGVLDPRLTFTRAANTATVINSSGLVQTVNADVPRFDHDPTTLAPRGLLIEGAATNLALQSDTLPTPTNWVANAITRTNVSAVTPDGNTTATTCGLSHTGSGSFRSQAITVTASTKYTFSFWAKNNGGSVALYRAYNVSGSADIVAETSYFSQINGSTWTRVQFTFTTPVGCTSVYVYPLSQSSGTSNVLVWGAQMEQGSGASSYIPTGASQVQRLADICYMANADYGFSTSGGTYLAEWHRGSIITAGSSGTNALATDYASGRWLGIYTTGASSTGTAGSWSGYLNSSGAVAGINKMAVSYSSWVASASGNTSLNGGAIVSGTLTLGTTPTYLFIGAASGTAPYSGGGYRDPLNNCVRRIKYWPIALSNAQLQSLTT